MSNRKNYIQWRKLSHFQGKPLSRPKGWISELLPLILALRCKPTYIKTKKSGKPLRGRDSLRIHVSMSYKQTNKGTIDECVKGSVECTCPKHDVKKSEEYLRSHGVEPCTFLDLLEKSDFVSVHVPLIENTRGLINKRSFKRMKPEAYLISTARGGIVDEEALFQALENGELRGAALDVFENEPPGLTPIIQHPRVIVTPHVSAQTKESQAQTGIDVANEVLAALSEKPLRWKID